MSLNDSDDVAWYSSAVDAWVAVVLAVVPLIAGGAVIAAVITGEGGWSAVLTLLVIAAIYRGLVFPVRYGFAKAHLVIRFGLVRQRIPYSQIRSVRPTRSPLSSPALSLNRLRIDHGGGILRTTMISPERRQEFLDQLSRCTGLRLSGDALLARDG